MNRAEKQQRRASLAAEYQAGADIESLASKYSLHPAYVRNIIIGFGIKVPRKRGGGRPRKQPEGERSLPKVPKYYFRGRVYKSVWDLINWKCLDVEIARVLNVSRERVRQVREAKAIPSSAQCPRGIIREFTQFVQANRESLTNMTLLDILCKFNKPVVKGIAINVLLKNNVTVLLPRQDPRSVIPFAIVNWRLPNLVLFRIWNVSLSLGTFTRIRSRRQLGSATLFEGPQYEAAVAEEERKAAEWRQTPEGKVVSLSLEMIKQEMAASAA